MFNNFLVLYNALSHHSLSYLQEAGYVCTLYVIYVTIWLSKIGRASCRERV